MQYFEPNFIGEALVVLDRFGGRAKVLAGGTLLGPHLRAHPGDADALVNLKRIRDLSEIRLDGSTLHIGALATARPTPDCARKLAPSADRQPVLQTALGP